MNTILIVLLFIMIVFTVYNFWSDVRNSLNTGKPIIEGNENIRLPSAKTLRIMFDRYDTDGSGTIERSEISKIFRDFGEDLTSNEEPAILALIDSDSNEKINFEEFMNWILIYERNQRQLGLRGAAGKELPTTSAAEEDDENNKLTQSTGFEDTRSTPEEPTWLSDEISDDFIQLEDSITENGVIFTKNTGVCPHNCKASEFANSSCVDEIFEGKEYKKCKWTKDGKNDSQCDTCGAVLIPKNEYGYAKTDVGDTIQKQTTDKITNQDFYNEGQNFIHKLAEHNEIALPKDITSDNYIETGKLLYKYKYTKTTETTSSLHKYVKAVLTPPDFKNEDRNGGSNSAYTLNYKPIDPRCSPNPYDSSWQLF